MPAQLVKVTFHGGSLKLKDKNWRGYVFKREAGGVNWLPENDAKIAAHESDFSVDWEATIGDNKNEIADLRALVENLSQRVADLEDDKGAATGEAEAAVLSPARRGRPPKGE